MEIMQFQVVFSIANIWKILEFLSEFTGFVSLFLRQSLDFYRIMSIYSKIFQKQSLLCMELRPKQNQYFDKPDLIYTGLKIFLTISIGKKEITETIKILREGQTADTRITTLNLRRTEFGLFGDLLGRILWDMILWDGQKRGPRELVDYFFQAQAYVQEVVRR